MEFGFEMYNVGDTPVAVHKANVSADNDVPIATWRSGKPAAKIFRAGNDASSKFGSKHKPHGELAFQFG